MPLLIGLFYLCYEYLTVYTGSEILEFYVFNRAQPKETYLQAALMAIVVCFLLLALSAWSIRLKKSWLLGILSFLNFAQLINLLFYF